MKTFSRRSFLQCSGGILAFSLTDQRFLYRNNEPLLSFSTLGCPDWTLDQILDFASLHKYHGVEIRGIQRELDLSKISFFSNDASIKTTLQKFKDKGLKVVGLGSSAAMHHRETSDRSEALDEAKRFIDIAEKLNCPYIRVFPDKLPAGHPKEETMNLMSDGLSELGNHSKGSGVNVLMETHGDLLWSDDIAKVMNTVNNKQVGLVWDIANMWARKKEPLLDVHRKLNKWIHHAHIKDLEIANGKERYTLLGQGNVPIFEAIDVLAKNGYKGYYSFEWEKLWHPEIEAPEIAIAQYTVAMREHFKQT